ncbi:MAG: hypothetical protein IT350_14620 [Deltaproteobacteria bacterium]|nr:hypothetical protein [Deltaproteobacteria bacterium]
MATKQSKPKPDIDLTISVLIYDEDGYRVAHGLEMNLKGRGETDREALAELVGLVKAQVAFALRRNEPDLIYRPAPKTYFRRFREARERALRSFPRRTKLEWKNAVSSYLPLGASSRNELRA